MRSFISVSVTLILSATLVVAEELTMTTYYPAPSGKYQEMSVVGNVGVGTTVPGGVLPPGSTIPPADINDPFGHSGTPKIVEVLPSVNGGDVGLFLRRPDHLVGLDLWSDSGSGPVFLDSRWYSAGDLKSGGFLFRTHTSQSYGSGRIVNAFRIDGSGNVGIGTTVPGGVLPHGFDDSDPRVLEIRAPGNGDAGLFLRKTVNSANGFDLWASGTSGLAILDSRFNSTGAPEAGGFLFRTHTSSSADVVNALKIDGLGNMGVGSMSPNAKLDVIGEVRVKASGGASADFAVRQDGTTRAYMIGSDFISVGSTGMWGHSATPGGEINVQNKVLINNTGIKLQNGGKFTGTAGADINICLERIACNWSPGNTCPVDRPLLSGTRIATDPLYCCRMRLKESCSP